MSCTRRYLRLLVAFAVLVSIILPSVGRGLPVSADGGGDPEINIDADTADVGAHIKVEGTGFPEDEHGQLVWATTGEVLAKIETDDDGKFDAKFTVPAAEGGDHTIVATVGGDDADVELTVNATAQPTETPTEAPTEAPTEVATEVPTEEPTEAPTEEPTQEATEVPTDEPTQEATEVPTEKPTKEATEAPTEEPTKEATEATAQSTREATKEPTREATATKRATAPSTSRIAAAAVDGELYVSTSGSDSAAGTKAAPFRTLQKALDVARAGATINLMAGTYHPSSTVMSSHDGTADAPIIIRSAPGEAAILAGPSSSRGLQINNDWYVIQDLEFTGADILLWLDGASNVLITGNVFHYAGGECVRIKNQSKNNTFSGNRVSNCGREGFTGVTGHKNGEGVYLGTAPEQRDRIGGVPDRTTGNVIENNVFTTNGSEAVDLKEDAEGNIVRYNVASGNRDPDGANFGVRGDRNQIIGNESFNSAGAGFRAGGDTVDGRVYGKNNVFRDNASHDNAIHSYKFMVGPQDVDCSNTATRDGGERFYFGTTRFSIPCVGGGGTPSTPTSTPRPTATPTKAPTPGDGVGGSGNPDVTEITPSDDTQAASQHPETKYGASRSFRVDGSPQTVAYLKFKVSGIAVDAVRTVTLRLYVTEGGAGLTLHRVGSQSWTEGGLSWSNRPTIGGAIAPVRSGRDAAGTWVEFDATAVVTKNGTYSFGLTTTSPDGYTLASSEAAGNRPRLVIRYRD